MPDSRQARPAYRPAARRGAGPFPWQPALAVALALAAGCGTTRVTNTQRAATEQLLVSAAVDQSVSRLDFRALAGKPVYFDAQYLAPGADQGYVVSSLRQQLLAAGCLLQESRAQATYVVEARCGGIGTDQQQVLIGVPQMNLPSVLPGQPSAIPEIPLAKKTDQKAVAKIAVFAYNRRTGRPVWQSGVVQADSTAKDTWVMGAGPFRRGTLGEATEIAGRPVAIPLLSGKEDPASLLAVTRPASWAEGPPSPRDPAALASAAPGVKEGTKTDSPRPTPAAPSVESVASGGPNPKGAAAPATEVGGGTMPVDAVRLIGYLPEAVASPGQARKHPAADPAKTTAPPAEGDHLK